MLNSCWQQTPHLLAGLQHSWFLSSHLHPSSPIPSFALHRCICEASLRRLESPQPRHRAAASRARRIRLSSGKGALSLLNPAQRSIASPPISTLNPPRPEPQPQPSSQRPPRHRPRLVCFARSPLVALFSYRYPALSSICGAPTTRCARFNAPFSFSPAARLCFSLVTRHGRSDKRQRRALPHRRAHR
jgi:hypothetical protein